MNLIAFAALALSVAVTASVPSRVEPVRIGVHGNPDLDACLGVGRTTSAVSARLAPSDSASISVSLEANQELYLCGSSPDGEWESVVIPNKAGHDCGVSTPVTVPRIYTGPCRSGWLPSKHIQILAG